jgi:hypothetical protein
MVSATDMAAPAARVLYPRRGVALIGGVLSTVLTIASLLAHDASTTVPAMFFAVAAIVCFGRLDGRGSYLKIEPDRLVVSSLYRRTVLLKDDVASFGVVKPFGSVGAIVKAGRSPERLTRFAVSRGKWDAVLPDTYGMRPQQLVDVLEAWRTS